MPRNLSCTTFFQWAAKSLGKWNERMWWPSDIERAVARMKDSFPALEKLSTAFLTDEIGWIKDHRLLTRELYHDADRAGRGTSLRGSQREEMWRLFHAYQNKQKEKGATDWHNIALRFHEAAVVEKTLPLPCFDAIFVDEAQFFAKAWFEIISEEERGDLRRDHTRLLYMGFTRAGQRLVVLRRDG